MTVPFLAPVSTPEITKQVLGSQSGLTDDDGQATEFNDIFSSSLGELETLADPQQGLQGITAGLEAVIPGLVAGQELPPSGEILPSALTESIAADSALLSTNAEISAQQATVIIPQTADIASAVVTTLPGDTVNAGKGHIQSNPDHSHRAAVLASTQLPQVSVETATIGVSNSAHKAGTVNLPDASPVAAAVSQLVNSRVESGPAAVASTATTASEAALAQLSTSSSGSQSENNSFSAGSNQRDSFFNNGLPAVAADTKQDFMRLLERGTQLLGRENSAVVSPLATETTAAARLTVPEGQKATMESFQLPQNIHKPGWTNDFGSRVAWMSKEGIHSARLQLNPHNMGSIEVKISIQNDQANISFLSQNSAVRDVIEASLPRLREMMTESGVKLEQANVSSNSDAQQQKQQAANADDAHKQNTGLADEDLNESEQQAEQQAIVLSEQGDIIYGVDYFV